MKYECDQCGACCKHLVVEADLIDIMREPRLIEADRHYRGKPVEEVLVQLQDEFRAVMIAGSKPCHFLGPDDRCTIYPTRPNECVAMPAGDEQCQMARAAVGLPPLLPVDSDSLPS